MPLALGERVPEGRVRAEKKQNNNKLPTANFSRRHLSIRVAFLDLRRTNGSSRRYSLALNRMRRVFAAATFSPREKAGRTG